LAFRFIRIVGIAPVLGDLVVVGVVGFGHVGAVAAVSFGPYVGAEGPGLVVGLR
jgi:hypothetical protein